MKKTKPIKKKTNYAKKASPDFYWLPAGVSLEKWKKKVKWPKKARKDIYENPYYD